MNDEDIKKFIEAYKAKYGDDANAHIEKPLYFCLECGFGFDQLKQILELAKELKL